MPCSKSVTISGQQGTIYWGLTEPTPFSPYFVSGWVEADFLSLFAALSSEVGPYRAGAYNFDQTIIGVPPLANAWFCVPDSYATPSAVTGFQFAYGVAGSPTDNVQTQTTAQNANDAWLNLNAVANAYTGAYHDPGGALAFPQTANGWNYFLTTVGGIDYRIYVFCDIYSASAGVVPNPDTTATRERTAGVATVTGANYTTWNGPPVYTVITFPGTPSFDGISEIPDYFIITPFTYANAGPDVGVTADGTGTMDFFYRGADFLGDLRNDPVFTLFVST